VTTSGKEPATFQVVAQCLNKMRILEGTSAIIVNKHFLSLGELPSSLGFVIKLNCHWSKSFKKKKFRFW